MGVLLHAGVQTPGRPSPPCWAERQDGARHPGDANTGEMLSGNTGESIPH